MENEYTLDLLIETFKRHRDRFEETRQHTNDFNLPKALLFVCEHMNRMNEDIKILNGFLKDKRDAQIQNDEMSRS